MKRTFAIALLVMSVATVLVASAALAGSAPAWTQSRAQQIVVRDATFRLPASQRASFEGELHQAVARFRGLEWGALDERDFLGAGIYRGLTARYSSALRKVQYGLALDAAECIGSRTVGDGRFRRFRCVVTSEVLQIPSSDLLFSEEGLPTIVERESVSLGPFRAQLDVRVSGRSAITFRQLEPQS